MARAFVCRICNAESHTDQTRGALPHFCGDCERSGAAAQSRKDQAAERQREKRKSQRSVNKVVKIPRLPAPRRTPFTAAAGRAPVPASTEPEPPGILETKLRGDLAMLDRRLHPMNASVEAMAITLARAADRCPPHDVRGLLQVTKELRSLIETIGGVLAPPPPAVDPATIPDDPTPGEPTDVQPDHSGPFGPVRAEVLDPPPVGETDLGPVLGPGGGGSRPALHAVAAGGR